KNERAQKSKNEVEAISGATISSRAVVAGLNKHAKKIIEALKKR
ncbi:MAG: FMN-binding protein, partial [Actinomycetia bacterium]|nr:FMN-binding protein [Actinomycetes bacterium]